MCWKNVLTLWVGCLWFPSIRKALPAEDREEKITSEQYTCPMWISASYTCPMWIYSASADVCTVSQNLSNKSIKELYPREQHHLLVLNCFDAILMHFQRRSNQMRGRAPSGNVGSTNWEISERISMLCLNFDNQNISRLNPSYPLDQFTSWKYGIYVSPLIHWTENLQLDSNHFYI